MKKIGKFFNFLIAFALIVMAFVPFQRVDAVYDPGYDIVVTKMLVKDISQWATGGTLVTDGENAGYRRGLDSNTYYTGGKMTDQELTKYFGQNKVLKGVYFELRKDTKNGTIVKEGLTDDNGQIFFKGLQKGTYWLVENKEKSKLKDSDKKQLAGVAAVPMEIKLPVYKKDGSTFTTMDSNNALHVYPKNTIDEPSIEKKVNENDMKEAGFDINFVQDNQSMSVKGVLRGLHFQKHFPQCKLVRAVRGSVFDVAVDLRSDSKT